jgi:protein transport protein SEC24
MTNATEMIFGTIDSDKSVSVELKHDDKLPVESSTYIQVKILLFLLLNFNIYFK